MLPSGLCMGPLAGSLYRISSAKLRPLQPKLRPRARYHAVLPSLPTYLTASNSAAYSSSHGTIAWLIGTILPMRASRHSFNVRNWPLIRRTPVSTPPFDWLSYLGGCSVET